MLNILCTIGRLLIEVLKKQLIRLSLENLACVCVLGEGVSILANAFMTDIFVCCNLLMVIIILFILEWELL